MVPVERRFSYPTRPDLGQEGRPIQLRTNHFQIFLPKDVVIYHYNVSFEPKTLPHQVKRSVVQEMVEIHFNNFRALKPVFDGRSNLYTNNPIWLGSGDNRAITLKVSIPDERSTIFSVRIRRMDNIVLSNLQEAVDGILPLIPSNAIQAIDTILRHLPSITVTPVGRSFFSSPEGYYHPLGEGKEVWLGYHQNVRPSMWKMMVTIDSAATPFFKEQSVMDFLFELLDETQVQNIKEKGKCLSDVDKSKFKKRIKGIKIQVTHLGTMKRKYRVCNVTKYSPLKQTFPLELENGQIVDCTVAKYFWDKYKIRLQYANLPCLQVGQETKHIYFPLEVCHIVKGQRYNKKLTDKQTSAIIQAASSSALEREAEINARVKTANFNNDPYVQEFGLKVSESMITIPGRVLPPPKLQFQGPVIQTPSQGVWDMRGKTFFLGIEVRVWALACFAPKKVTEQDLRKYTQDLQEASFVAGMPIVAKPCFCKYATTADQVESMFQHLKSTFPDLQLVIVILPGKTPIYAEVKRVGDTQLGIPTQCVQYRNVIAKHSSQALSNLCLKINVKLGGINSILLPTMRHKVFNEPIIFLGVDVSHSPVCETKAKVSIASVVGSIDAHPSRYSATVRVQPHGQVIIQDLTSMVQEVLMMFYKATGGFKPHRIILYRTGVPENKLDEIQEKELVAVRAACLLIESDYQPGITFIVVQKKHHTRLFCNDRKDLCGKGKNIPPGTTVDHGITHPRDFDFFLCSHQGIQGTSRPSHYHLVWDDNEFKSDELQSLTYQLCYTYARCTRSVSIPAPVYYAHLVACRARYHLGNNHLDNNGDGEGSQENINQNYNCLIDDRTPLVIAKSVTVHTNSKTSMYFA